MKFQAAVIFDFKADSIADAARKLDELLKHAEERHQMAHGHVELRTPPADAASAPSVVLPYFVAAASRDPAPAPRPARLFG